MLIGIAGTHQENKVFLVLHVPAAITLQSVQPFISNGFNCTQ